MTPIVEGDPLCIGQTGYTMEEGLAVLNGTRRVETPDSQLDLSCVHRGPFLEIGACDQCGEKGQPFEVFACTVHGRCSFRRKHRKVKSCAACEERGS